MQTHCFRRLSLMLVLCTGLVGCRGGSGGLAKSWNPWAKSSADTALAATTNPQLPSAVAQGTAATYASTAEAQLAAPSATLGEPAQMYGHGQAYGQSPADPAAGGYPVVPPGGIAANGANGYQPVGPGGYYDPYQSANAQAAAAPMGPQQGYYSSQAPGYEGQAAGAGQYGYAAAGQAAPRDPYQATDPYQQQAIADPYQAGGYAAAEQGAYRDPYAAQGGYAPAGAPYATPAYVADNRNATAYAAQAGAANPANQTAWGNPQYSTAQSDTYQPGATGYTPGSTGYSPPGVQAYQAPSYQSPQGAGSTYQGSPTTPARDPHYRPGGTSDYLPRGAQLDRSPARQGEVSQAGYTSPLDGQAAEPAQN